MPNEQEALLTETIQRPHCGPAIDPVGPCIRRNDEKVTPLTHTDPNPRGKGPKQAPDYLGSRRAYMLLGLGDVF